MESKKLPRVRYFSLPSIICACSQIITEILREHQRSINRAQRDIDRERTNLQNQEKKVIMEIKKAAKQGQMVCDETQSFVHHHNIILGSCEDYG